MSVKSILLMILVIMLAAQLAGENKSKTGMGFHAGTSTGIGYAMRFMSEQKSLGGQVTLGAIATKDFSMFNLGANLIGVIDNFKSGRFYVMAGGMIGSSSDENEYGEDVTNSYWCFGVGPGVELELFKNIRFAVELPFTYNNDNELIMYIPQGGIYYYFK